MKEILDILWRAQDRGELRFLIIGGRGLEAHGYQRYTKDIDLMIATDDLAVFEPLLTNAGFECLARNSSFNRYRHTSLVYEPMDVMKVDRITFEKFGMGARHSICTDCPCAHRELRAMWPSNFMPFHKTQTEGRKTCLICRSFCDLKVRCRSWTNSDSCARDTGRPACLMN